LRLCKNVKDLDKWLGEIGGFVGVCGDAALQARRATRSTRLGHTEAIEYLTAAVSVAGDSVRAKSWLPYAKLDSVREFEEKARESG
jgi:hypothetical protein